MQFPHPRGDKAMTQALEILQQHAGMLFAYVVLIVAFFLIARVARISQGLSLALALTPMAYAVALHNGMLLGLI
jgi:hypothetical protein